MFHFHNQQINRFYLLDIGQTAQKYMGIWQYCENFRKEKGISLRG